MARRRNDGVAMRSLLGGFIMVSVGVLGLEGLDAEELVGWKDVSAIFAERCVMCHSAQGAGLGLRLDSYSAALAGSINGPVLLPGDSSNSELLRRLRGQSLPRMPFLSYPLTEEQIALIGRWIDTGLNEATHTPEAIDGAIGQNLGLVENE